MRHVLRREQQRVARRTPHYNLTYTRNFGGRLDLPGISLHDPGSMFMPQGHARAAADNCERGEFTNAFTLVNLASPNTTLSSSRFGQIHAAQPNSAHTGTGGPVQVGFRMTL